MSLSLLKDKGAHMLISLAEKSHSYKKGGYIWTLNLIASISDSSILTLLSLSNKGTHRIQYEGLASWYRPTDSKVDELGVIQKSS